MATHVQMQMVNALSVYAGRRGDRHVSSQFLQSQLEMVYLGEILNHGHSVTQHNGNRTVYHG